MSWQSKQKFTRKRFNPHKNSFAMYTGYESFGTLSSNMFLCLIIRVHRKHLTACDFMLIRQASNGWFPPNSKQNKLFLTRTSYNQTKWFQFCQIPVMLKFTMEIWPQGPELSSTYGEIRITHNLLVESFTLY